MKNSIEELYSTLEQLKPSSPALNRLNSKLQEVLDKLNTLKLSEPVLQPAEEVNK